MTLFGRGAGLLGSFLRAALVARLLGPSGMGVYSIAASVAFYLALIADLGLGSASIYLIGRGRSPALVAGMTLGVGAIVGLLVGAASLGLLPFAGVGALEGLDVQILLIIAATVPLLVLQTHFESLLIGLRRLGRSALLSIARRVCHLVLTAAGLFLVSVDVRLALLALPLSTVPSIVAGLRLVRQATGPFRLRGAPIRPAVAFGLRSWVGVAAQVLNYRADLLLINLFLGPSATGVYGIGLLLSETLWYIPQSAAVALYPRAASDVEPRRTQRTVNASRLILLLSASGGLVLLLTTSLLRTILAGPEFADADVVVRILIPGTVVAAVAKVLSSDLAGRGRPGLVSIAALLTAVVNIGLNLVLIPVLGLNGAALASTVSYALGGLLVLVLFLRASGASVWGFLVRGR